MTNIIISLSKTQHWIDKYFLTYLLIYVHTYYGDSFNTWINVLIIGLINEYNIKIWNYTLKVVHSTRK